MANTAEVAVHVASTGSGFQVTLELSNTVNKLQEALASPTNIPIESQILLCDGQPMRATATLDSFNVADGVYVYDARTWKEDYMETLELPGLNPPETQDLSISGALSSLDVSKFQQIFEKHVSQLGEYLEACTVGNQEYVRVLGRIKVQSKALLNAKKSLSSQDVILRGYEAFREQSAEKTERHRKLLESFESDIDKTKKIKLHPAIAPEKGATLHSVLPEAALRDWAHKCGNDVTTVSERLASLHERFEALLTSLDDYNSKNDDFGLVGLVEIEEQIAQRVEEVSDAYTQAKRGQNYSLTVSADGATEELREVYRHNCEQLLPHAKAAVEYIYTQYESACNVFAHTTQLLRERLQETAAVQDRFMDIRERQVAYAELLNEQIRNFDQLYILQRLPAAYFASLAEAARRRTFSKLYIDSIRDFVHTVEKIRVDEQARREQFHHKHGKWLPDNVIPGLDSRVSHIKVSITPFDTELPAIDSEELEKDVGPLNSWLASSAALTSKGLSTSMLGSNVLNTSTTGTNIDWTNLLPADVEWAVPAVRSIIDSLVEENTNLRSQYTAGPSSGSGSEGVPVPGVRVVSSPSTPTASGPAGSGGDTEYVTRIRDLESKLKSAYDDNKRALRERDAALSGSRSTSDDAVELLTVQLRAAENELEKHKETAKSHAAKVTELEAQLAAATLDNKPTGTTTGPTPTEAALTARVEELQRELASALDKESERSTAVEALSNKVGEVEAQLTAANQEVERLTSELAAAAAADGGGGGVGASGLNVTRIPTDSNEGNSDLGDGSTVVGIGEREGGTQKPPADGTEVDSMTASVASLTTQLDEESARVCELESEVETLRKRVSELETQAAALTAEYEKSSEIAEARTEELQTRASGAETRAVEAEADAAAKQRTVDELVTQLDGVRAELREEREKVAALTLESEKPPTPGGLDDEERNGFIANIASATAEVSQLRDEINQANNRAENAEARLKEVETELGNTRNELTNLQNLLGEMTDTASSEQHELTRSLEEVRNELAATQLQTEADRALLREYEKAYDSLVDDAWAVARAAGHDPGLVDNSRNNGIREAPDLASMAETLTEILRNNESLLEQSTADTSAVHDHLLAELRGRRVCIEQLAEGDLALFFPTRDGDWVAFAPDAGKGVDQFLNPDCIEAVTGGRTCEYLLLSVIQITTHTKPSGRQITYVMAANRVVGEDEPASAPP